MSNDNQEALNLQLDVAERLLARNLAWIAAADAKVPPIFAIDSAMLGVLAALIPAREGWSISAAIATFVAFLFLCPSIVSLALATFPRLTGPKGSLVFFGTATMLESREFVQKVREGVTPTLVEDVARQAYRNAEIAGEKYKHVKRAQLLMFGGAIPWLVAVALLYLTRK